MANKNATQEAVTETAGKRAQRGSSLQSQAKAMFMRMVVEAQANAGNVSNELLTEAIELFDKFPKTLVSGEPATVQLEKVEKRLAHIYATHFEDSNEDELRLLLNRKRKLIAEIKGKGKDTETAESAE